VADSADATPKAPAEAYASGDQWYARRVGSGESIGPFEARYEAMIAANVLAREIAAAERRERTACEQIAQARIDEAEREQARCEDDTSDPMNKVEALVWDNCGHTAWQIRDAIRARGDAAQVDSAASGEMPRPFATPASFEEAVARRTHLGAEVQRLQQQIAAAREKPGDVAAHAAWRARVLHRCQVATDEIAFLRAWLTAHQAQRAGTRALLERARVQLGALAERGVDLGDEGRELLSDIDARFAADRAG
jgi:hypothetical protein